MRMSKFKCTKELYKAFLQASSVRYSGLALSEVSPTEFRLMQFFMTHPDKVYSRTQLLDQVWGRSVYIEERTIDVHIRRLRRILGEHGREDLVQTVRGFGYRFSLM